MTRILLARHGQSIWNALGLWQGQADPPLSELGRLQARHAARAVGAIELIVSSDLERARHTAEIIAEELGIGPVAIDPALRERDAGEWSGLTRAEIEQRWPGFLEDGGRPPGWEAQEALLARSLEALAAIDEEYRGASVLVITHGGVVYAIEEHHGEPHHRLANLEARNLAFVDGTTRLGERVQLVDHSELAWPEQPSPEQPSPEQL